MPLVSQIGTIGSFFVTGGAVRPDSPSYVERQCDHDLLQALDQGQFCYVLTSRQMGKSSLVVHAANKLRQEEGTAVVVWDLTAIGQNLNFEQWYDGLCVRMGEQLQREDEFDEFWMSHLNLGPCQRLFAAIREIILPQVKRLVIFVDEIDMVRSLPFVTDEFFAAVRECYNRRAEDPVFERLTFCLLGVATPSDLIQSTRMTPFNIGLRIELNDFREEEAASLVRGLRKAGLGTRRSVAILKRILYWTQGHPYLTQRLCLAVVEGGGHSTPARSADIDQSTHELYLSKPARERDDNLIFVRERLLRAESDRVSLLLLYEDILRGKRVADDESNELVSDLHLSGIVKSVKGRLVPRNRIYQRVFDRAWVHARLPDAELRRQRAAYYRGVMRTTALGSVIAAILVCVALIAINEAAKARRALAHAYYSQAKAKRHSGSIGQRVEGLEALAWARPSYTNESVICDEVLACLALGDLTKANLSTSLHPRGAFDLCLDSEVSAFADTSGVIVIRGLGDGRIRKTLPTDGWRVERLYFGPMDDVLLAGYSDGTDGQVTLWNWRTGQKLFTVPHDIRGQAIEISSNGRKLALGQASGGVVIYALPSGTKLNEIELKLNSGSPRIPQALRFNPSGDLLAESTLDDFNVQLWGLETGYSPQTPLMSLYHPAEVHDLAWHPRGECLATACADNSIYLWDTDRPEQPRILKGHEDGVTAVAFNHRGTLIASLGWDETIRLWMPATDLQVVGRLDGRSFDRLRFSSDDRRLMAMGMEEGSNQIWDVHGGEYVALHLRGGPVDAWRSLDFSPDNRFLAAVNSRQAVLWEAASGRETGALNFTNAHAALFAADSGSLVASSDEGLLRGVWSYGPSAHQLAAGDVSIGVCQDNLSELGAMALTQDRNRAAIAHKDEVLLVSLASGCELIERKINVGIYYHRLALHPTGHWVAAMEAGSNIVHLWNLAKEGGGDPRPVVVASSDFFTFSPDGAWWVTCWESQFAFFRVGDWQQPAFQIPRQHLSDQHAPVAFTRDGSVVALASTRYSIQLWQLYGQDQLSPKLIATLEAPERIPLEMVAISSDNRYLAAATQNQTIHLWNMELLGEGLSKLQLHHNWPVYP